MVKQESKLIENPEEIVLTRRRNLNDFLGHPPSSILSFGPTMVFFLLLVLLLLGWLVKYPDVIPAQTTIFTENPAIRVYSRTSGKINLLLVENESVVESGQALALLDNPADWQDVQKYEAFLQSLNTSQGPPSFANINSPKDLQLGSLQNSYAILLQKLKDFRFFNGQTGAFSKIQSLQNQIKYTTSLNDEIKNQETTLNQEVAIALLNLQRNKDLRKEGLISDIDLKESETNHLQYKRQLENIRTLYISNNIRIEELQSQIIDIRESRSSGKSTRQLTLEEDIDRIQSEIDKWKLDFLITAPIAGKVSLADIWSAQQFVNANEEIMAIVPTNGSGKMIGRAVLPISSSGKVKPGQRANIMLDGFPFQEYGVIPSKVGEISLIPQKENYLLEIQLPDSLITTYQKRIPFRQEMSGTTNIITEDRRVLERILDRLLSILKNS